MAGLVPRPALDKLYAEGVVDPQEYVTLLLAQGQQESTALGLLAVAHGKEKPEEEPSPEYESIEADLPEYAGPKRSAKRPSKKGPELRGHPLD